MLNAYCHRAAHTPTTTGRNEVRREKKSSSGIELTMVTEKQILGAHGGGDGIERALANERCLDIRP